MVRLAKSADKISKTALLAGAALALPVASKAGVVVVNGSNGVPFTLNGAQGGSSDSKSIDLNLDTILDFSFTANGGTTATSNVATDTVTGLQVLDQWVGPAMNPLSTASPLSAGTVIGPGMDPSLAFHGGTGTLQKVSGDPTLNAQKGPWPTNGSSAYLGVQFADADNMLHYGWIQLSACVPDKSGPSNTCNDPQSLLTVNQYAYQSDPNVAIQAGQTTNTVTPEPSSIALFALGAAGLAAYRRRKRAA